MRDALFTIAEHEYAEQLLLAFLYEVDQRLTQAVETYKSTVPKRLLQANDNFDEGVPLLSVQAELDQLSQQQRTDARWVTGSIDEHFQQFFIQCYTRAEHIARLTTVLEGTGYKALTPAYFQRFAEVLIHERYGIIINSTGTNAATTGCRLYIGTLYADITKAMGDIPIAYDDLESVEIHNADGTANESIVLKNYGDKAIIASITSADVLIPAATVDLNTGARTPVEQSFDDAQINSGIDLAFLPLPEEHAPLQNVTMNINDERIVRGQQIFRGEHISSYSISPSVQGIVTHDLDKVTGDLSIVANNDGNVTLTLVASNPSGETPTNINITVNP